MKTHILVSIIIGVLATSVAQADSIHSINNNELILNCFDISLPFTANTSTDLTENDRLEEANNESNPKLECCLHGGNFHPGQNNVTVVCENTKSNLH